MLSLTTVVVIGRRIRTGSSADDAVESLGVLNSRGPWWRSPFQATVAPVAVV
jgi:hypothetical protein